VDGNGRTGRVINILFLVHLGILDIPVLYLSRYIIRNKGDYYAKLNAVTAKGEWENWVLYMLDAIRDTADWTYSRINLIRELMVSTRDLCRENLPKNVYSHELIEQIFLQPYCKPAHLVEAGIGHRQTAMKYLKELERIGVLQSQKIGRDRIYVNVRLYELLKYDSSETNKSYS
jgi:Fic family protein